MTINKKSLRAFVRYDGLGRVISSSVILARKKPKVGDWKEIQTYECCDPFNDYLLLENSTPTDQNMLLQEDGGRIIL